MVTGVVASLKVKSRAHAAALRHGMPARHMAVILVTGEDGARSTIAYLASILRIDNQTIGVITQNYIEIGATRAKGSDQADVVGDPFRLQGLLAQMRKAGCSHVLIELPAGMPAHQFTAAQPTMVVVRRCGDMHLDGTANAAKAASCALLLSQRPRFVVVNRDDPCYGNLVSATVATEQKINFGTHDKSECKMRKVQLHPKGSAVSLLIDHQTELELVTCIPGKQALYSAVTAAAAAYLLHVPITTIEEGIGQVKPLPAELQYLKLQRPYDIVIDNSTTAEGIAESLETLRHFAKNRLITLAGGHITQSAATRRIVGELVGKIADRTIVTDGEYSSEESPAQVRQQFMQGALAVTSDATVDEIADRQAAIEKALSIMRRGDVLVVLGSSVRPYRQLGTERLAWSDAQRIVELME